MKTFLICPVRAHDPKEWQGFVDRLEKDGWTVYFPPRDTNQDDPTGLKICADNLRAMSEADAVHVIWDGLSQGCLFDLGMAFALGKKVIPASLPKPTLMKSFQNMVALWAHLRPFTG